MTTLEVPFHLPAIQARRFLERELRFRRVVSVKLKGNFVVIQHERARPEDIIEMESCIPDLSFVL